MIDFAPLIKIVPIFAAALISPGPDFMMITSMALSRGRTAGVLAACGIAAGVLVYVILCLFGFAVIFARIHWLLVVIRICGGAYLIYIAYQLWKSSFTPVTPETQAGGLQRGKARNPFVVGFLTNMTNPKAIAFFTSIFAVTLPAETNTATQAAIILVMGVMPIIWFSIVTFGLSTPAMRKVYLRWSHWIDRVAGTILGFFGVRLILSKN